MLIPLRDENPRVIIPKVTYAIVALNIAVFLLQMGVGSDPISEREFTLSYGLIPAAATGVSSDEIVKAWEESLSLRSEEQIHLNANVHTPVITIITSMFMHGGFMHILWNMVFIWIFADNVEGLFGHTRFLIFYLICGIGAGIAQIISDPSSTIPMIGASGAIAGVLGAYMVSFPKAKVIAFLPFFFWWGMTMRIPALFYLGFWFLIQLTNGLGTIGLNTTGGVAWFAHIGGFVTGIGALYLMKAINIRRI
ncbi:MAG: rhomboid family intramembrane serine protease [Candidatus Marinimicrobia bacterium]|nr:rhomboid family intramembrane serine protease [Candidatus Neomarinimicrobiota bacterium]